MQPGQDPHDKERHLPWGRIGWIVLFSMLVLSMAMNAIFRDVGNKAAVERVRQAEEAMTNGPKPAPVKVQPQADKPFSAEEAEREMAERERAVRAQVEGDLARKEDENRRKMERTNRDFDAQRRREAAELHARQNSRIP
jgi:hypothetical protein